MSAKVIFTDFRIVTEIKIAQDGRRVDFAIVDAFDSNQNIKFKIWVTAFDEAASKILRLKAKKGSLVDITAELVPYLKKGNDEEIEIGYKILDLSFSKSFEWFKKYSSEEKKEKPKAKEMSENDKKIASIKNAASILANNPFA